MHIEGTATHVGVIIITLNVMVHCKQALSSYLSFTPFSSNYCTLCHTPICTLHNGHQPQKQHSHFYYQDTV